MHSSTADVVIRLMRAGSTDALLALADGLEQGSVTLKSSSVGLSDLPAVTDDLAAVAFGVFGEIGGSCDEQSLALALRAAAGIRSEERLGRPQIEICWTGPEAAGPLVTRNAAAIERMIKECRDTGEVLLVGYSFTAPEGSFMERVIELLCEASKRRANIQIVLHRDEEEKNKQELLKSWDVFARKPTVFTWTPTDAHPYTKLHAKCLVVDRLQALVTSANFSFHGLESNIELGLVVRNQPIASAIHERFDHLINAGVLTPWEDGS